MKNTILNASGAFASVNQAVEGIPPLDPSGVPKIGAQADSPIRPLPLVSRRFLPPTEAKLCVNWAELREGWKRKPKVNPLEVKNHLALIEGQKRNKSVNNVRTERKEE